MRIAPTLALACIVACKSETAIAAPETKQILEKLRVEIEERYSYRDRLGVDWKKLFAEAAADLEKATTREQVVERLVKLLSNARDAHLELIVDGKRIKTDPANPELNFSFAQVKTKVTALKMVGKCIFVGKVDDFAYVLTSSLEKGKCDDLPADWTKVYPALASTSGMILDMRANNGGSEFLAQPIAGHFVAKPVVYAKSDWRDATVKGGFRPVATRTLQPITTAPRWTKPVVVLTGPTVMSSAESFVLMMRAAGATLIGTTTRGASANPRIVELGQGISVPLAQWRGMLPDGTIYEGIGIKPDISVPVTTAEIAAGDKVLDAAVAELKKRVAK